MMKKTVLGAFLLAGSLQLAGVAYAATTHETVHETAMDKAELAQLSPKLRSEVQTRLGAGQTAHGILETMLLNKVSSDFASGKVVASDFARGEIVVQNNDGQMKAFPFDVESLAIKN